MAATSLFRRRLGGARSGLSGAVVLSWSLGVGIFPLLVHAEPFLACFISLSFWCLLEARLQAQPETALRGGAWRFPGERWYLLFWTFLALGVLSKGLHGALSPLGTAILTALVVPGWRDLLRPIVS